MPAVIRVPTFIMKSRVCIIVTLGLSRPSAGRELKTLRHHITSYILRNPSIENPIIGPVIH